MNFAFAQSCVLLAAVDLDICTWIARGFNTSSQLAKRIGATEPALIRLLDTLCALNYLCKSPSGYELTPLSERYLVRDHDTYLGDLALQTRQEWDAWIHLPEIVRTGQPARIINEEPLGGTFFAPLAEYLFPLVYPLMRRICQRLEVGTHLHGLQVLDLGAGAAPSAIAVLERDADAHATAIDFHPVLERAREYAQQRGVGSRIQYQTANLANVELPTTSFDLVFASHVFRILGNEVTQRLISQSYQSLKPGGRLVVVETYKEPEHAERVFPHIISLNMLVNTSAGDTFSSRQMHEWLSCAGFHVEIWHDVGPDPVLIAIRP
jgi:SAM-dependent methyltransferase